MLINIGIIIIELLFQEMTKLEELIEKELEERKGKIKGPYAKYANSRYYSIFI